MTERTLDIGVYGARGIPSTYSGYETFLTALLPRLVERGHRVTMYCRRGSVSQEDDYLGVQKRMLPGIESKSLSTLSHGLLASVSARLAHHDVVLAVNVANAYFTGISRWTGQAIVLNTDGQEWERGKWGPLGRRVFRAAARVAGSTTTGTVADCRAMAAIYKDQFSTTSTVIPYFWTEIPIAPTSQLEQFDVQPDSYFLHAGRLIPENNAVAVARAYTATSSPWPFLFLGGANYDSPVERELQAIAAADSRVRVVGHVSHRDLFAALLKNARGYVHTHSVGGINPSLIEAMGVGALIVALATPFNREALGSTGYYFEAFHDELGDVLQAIATTPTDERDRQRSAAQHRALERFSAESVTVAYESLLLAASSGPRRSNVVVSTCWESERG